jgi:hypothetical protein
MLDSVGLKECIPKAESVIVVEMQANLLQDLCWQLLYMHFILKEIMTIFPAVLYEKRIGKLLVFGDSKP